MHYLFRFYVEFPWDKEMVYIRDGGRRSLAELVTGRGDKVLDEVQVCWSVSWSVSWSVKSDSESVNKAFIASQLIVVSLS